MGVKKWGKLLNDGVFFNSFYQQLIQKRINFTPFYLVREGIFNADHKPITTKLSPTETVMLGPADFRIIAARKDRDQSEEEMVAMLKKDSYCMGIKHKGEIVAYGWYELNNCTTQQISFPLKNHEAYLSGARTLEKYRGNNLAPYLRHQMYLHLKEKGFTTLYSITLFSNISSIRFKRKLGAYPIKLFLQFILTKHFRRVWLLRKYRDINPENH